MLSLVLLRIVCIRVPEDPHQEESITQSRLSITMNGLKPKTNAHETLDSKEGCDQNCWCHVGGL
jgi:hypothetical protein